MSVKVCGVPGSPYLRAVLIGLQEKGVRYDLVPIAGPETKQPEHLARHPFGRVPAFEHDGFALYDTQAILRYLDAARWARRHGGTPEHAACRFAAATRRVKGR